MTPQQNLGKRLFRNTFNFGIGSVLPKVIGLLLIPIYTVYLTPEDFGIAELCASMGAFMVILMRLGVPGSVTRFYFDFENNREEVRDYVTTVYYFLFGSSILIGLVGGVLLYWFQPELTPGVLFYPYIILVLINNFFSTNSDLQKRLLQAREQSRYMAGINVAVSLVSIGLTVLLVVYFQLGALGMVLAQALSSFIFFIQAQFYLQSELGGKFRKDFLKASLKYGRGLLPHHLFAALAPLLAKSLLAGTHSVAALGIFALALKLTMPLDVLYNSFNQGFQPVYFKTRKQIDAGERQLSELTDLFSRIWILAVGVYSVLILMAPWFIVHFIPIRYHDAIPLIPIIGLGFLGQILYMLQSSDLYYLKRTSIIPVITGLGLLVNLIISYFSVSRFGATGVAWASSIGFVTWAVVSYRLSHTVVPIFKLSFFIPMLGVAAIVAIHHVLDYQSFVFRSGVSLITIIGIFATIMLSSKSRV